MFLSRNDKRRLGLAALASIAAACLVALLISGPAAQPVIAAVPPPGSPQITGAFDQITRHVEVKPVPPSATPPAVRTVVHTRTYRSTWWTRGPVRRVISAPFRIGLFRRWR